MTRLKRTLLVIALGALTLVGLPVQAQAKPDDIAGHWKGTCTKGSTGATWKVKIVIRDNDTYKWTSTYSDGSTATSAGTVDRASKNIINKGRTWPYSLNGNHLKIKTAMAKCALTR